MDPSDPLLYITLTINSTSRAKPSVSSGPANNEFRRSGAKLTGTVTGKDPPSDGFGPEIGNMYDCLGQSPAFLLQYHWNEACSLHPTLNLMDTEHLLRLYDAPYAKSYNEKFLTSDLAKADAEHEVRLIAKLLEPECVGWMSPVARDSS